MIGEGQIFFCRNCEKGIGVSISGKGILTCCGETMVVGNFSDNIKEIKETVMYDCVKCENLIIVWKSGEGVLTCCGETMVRGISRRYYRK